MNSFVPVMKMTSRKAQGTKSWERLGANTMSFKEIISVGVIKDLAVRTPTISSLQNESIAGPPVISRIGSFKRQPCKSFLGIKCLQGLVASPQCNIVTRMFVKNMGCNRFHCPMFAFWAETRHIHFEIFNVFW